MAELSQNSERNGNRSPALGIPRLGAALFILAAAFGAGLLLGKLPSREKRVEPLASLRIREADEAKHERPAATEADSAELAPRAPDAINRSIGRNSRAHALGWKSRPQSASVQSESESVDAGHIQADTASQQGAVAEPNTANKDTTIRNSSLVADQPESGLRIRLRTLSSLSSHRSRRGAPILFLTAEAIKDASGGTVPAGSLVEGFVEQASGATPETAGKLVLRIHSIRSGARLFTLAALPLATEARGSESEEYRMAERRIQETASPTDAAKRMIGPSIAVTTPDKAVIAAAQASNAVSSAVATNGAKQPVERVAAKQNRRETPATFSERLLHAIPHWSAELGFTEPEQQEVATVKAPKVVIVRGKEAILPRETIVEFQLLQPPTGSVDKTPVIRPSRETVTPTPDAPTPDVEAPPAKPVRVKTASA